MIVHPRLITLGLTRQSDPMYIHDMSGKVILPFDPLVSNPIAPRDPAVYAKVEMLRLAVAVQSLLRGEREPPGATGLAAEVTPSRGPCSCATMKLLEMEIEYRCWREGISLRENKPSDSAIIRVVFVMQGSGAWGLAGEARDVSNHGRNYRVVIMVNWWNQCVGSKGGKVQWTVDGEKSIIRIEWQIAKFCR